MRCWSAMKSTHPSFHSTCLLFATTLQLKESLSSAPSPSLTHCPKTLDQLCYPAWWLDSLFPAMKHSERRGANEPKDKKTHSGAALVAGMETWGQKPLGCKRQLRGEDHKLKPGLSHPQVTGEDVLLSWWGLLVTYKECQVCWLLGGNLYNFSHNCLMLEENHQPSNPTHL